MIHDIVVVGGGPAGCHTASLLAREGFDVHVLEEHSIIGEPVDCSGVVGAESFATLGLPNSLRLEEIRALTLVSPSALKVCFSPPYPLAYIIDRAAFDRAIAERMFTSGVSLHLGAHVVDVRGPGDYVEVDFVRTSTLQSRNSKSSVADSIKAKAVILAGGPRYKLQKKLGMGMPGDFLKTAQTDLPVRGIKETKVLLGSQVAPDSFAWVVPYRRGAEEFARIGVSAKVSAVPYLRRLLAQLLAGGHLSCGKAPIRSWVIPISPIQKTYADRVLAVGDAAGQTKPTTGGGIYYGLLCAEIAAETVARAFAKGDFSSGILRGYEKAWRKKLGTELRLGAFFRRLVERLTDEEIDALFLIVQSDGVLSGIAQKARFDQHRDVILFALRHPGLGKIFLRGLFR